MNCRDMPRGAVPVGQLCDLPVIEAASILYMRRWCDGGKARHEIWADFDHSFGSSRGGQLAETFQQLCNFCFRQGRRAFARHSTGYPCVGADEACFANLIAIAADAETEDAMMMATLMVRVDMAPLVVGLAMDFGLGLKQMQLALPKDLTSIQSQAQPMTIH